MSQKLVVRSPVRLYRHLLRRVRVLPEETQFYYKNYVRQGFNSHKDETDPERIEQIMSRAAEDAEWIVKKYVTKSGWKSLCYNCIIPQDTAAHATPPHRIVPSPASDWLVNESSFRTCSTVAVSMKLAFESPSVRFLPRVDYSAIVLKGYTLPESDWKSENRTLTLPAKEALFRTC